MPFIHCALGPANCKKCQELEIKGETFALVRIFLKPFDYACPTTSFIKDGEKIEGPYDILQRFEDVIEAKNYAKKNNILVEYY